MSRILLLLLVSAVVATPAAAQLAWSTYVGGASEDALHDVAIGADGHIWADSTDLPSASVCSVAPCH